MVNGKNFQILSLLSDFSDDSDVENNENAQNEDSGCIGGSDGYFFVRSYNKIICCMTVIGQIEGHFALSSETKTTKYENMIPRIVSVDRNDDIAGLLLILNTIGGDIEAGLAISELIAGLGKPTVSFVLGGGHSIGIPLAVSAKYSYIAPTATMTIHPARMNGLVMGVPQQLEYFQNMQERIIEFVSRNADIKPERFREMMLSSGQLVSDFGTVLNGNDAVKEGIIDSVGNISDAFNKLNELLN